MPEPTAEETKEVKLQAVSGVMFFANVTYTEDSSLRQITIFVSGLNQDVAQRAIEEYVVQSLKAECPRVMSPVMMFPTLCAFISPKSSHAQAT